MTKVAIIWWGAAGLMCAATIAEYNSIPTISVYEKNSYIWAKIIISGWGRCNVTTAYYQKHDLISKYIRGRSVIQYAISQFGPRQIFKWFESHNVKLKIESDMRVFPISNDGNEIVWVFKAIFASQQIHTHVSTSIVWIQKLSHWFQLHKADWSSDDVDKVVIATGGQAYRHTGSTGDGYYFAQQCWHTITSLWPSLSSFKIYDERIYKYTGISFKTSRCHWTIWDTKYSADGSLLLTHFGISGPLTFILSAHLAFLTIDENHPYIVYRQPFADRNFDRRSTTIQKNCIENPRKHIHTILANYMPDRFVTWLLWSCYINEELMMTQLSKQQKHTIISFLGSGIPLKLMSRRPWDEFVTAWGVSIDEIDHKTMESLVCPGLYLVWEVIDVDGVTGWYNLTSSWATGRLAGKHIAQNCL